MVKKILLYGIVAIVIIVAIFCVVVATRPAHYQVERSAVINAPAAVVFAQVNDFHQMGRVVTMGEDRSEHEKNV
jgi:hypothetical protein